MTFSAYCNHSQSWYNEVFGGGGLVAKSRPTLAIPDCSPSGSSVHGISQTRILKWVAISFFRGSSPPGIKPGSPELQAGDLPTELWGKPWYLVDTLNYRWALAICLYKDEVTSCSAQWPSTIPESSSGWRVGMGVLCALGKIGRTGLQMARNFREKVIWAQLLHLLISGKPQKS